MGYRLETTTDIVNGWWVDITYNHGDGVKHYHDISLKLMGPTRLKFPLTFSLALPVTEKAIDKIAFNLQAEIISSEDLFKLLKELKQRLHEVSSTNLEIPAPRFFDDSPI